jgi:hypothetical protein
MIPTNLAAMRLEFVFLFTCLFSGPKSFFFQDTVHGIFSHLSTVCVSHAFSQYLLTDMVFRWSLSIVVSYIVHSY